MRERGKLHRERNDRHENDSIGDDGRRVERETGKRDRDRLDDRYENGHRRRDGHSERDNERERRQRIEFQDGDGDDEKGYRKREAGEVHTGKDGWHSRRDMQDEDDSRDGRSKRSARQRNGEVGDDYEKDRRRRGTRDDGDRKHRREKEGNEGRQDSWRLKDKDKEGDGKVNEDLKLQKTVNIARRKLERRLGQFREKRRGVHTAFQAGADDERGLGPEQC